MRGTTWLVEDRSNNTTFFKVTSGRVAVRDFGRRRTIQPQARPEPTGQAASPTALSRSGQGRIRTASFLAVGLAAVALALIAYFTDMLESPELSTVDTRFDIRGDQDKPT